MIQHIGKMSNGPFEMAHIIWTIWNGPYYMAHIKWVYAESRKAPRKTEGFQKEA